MINAEDLEDSNSQSAGNLAVRNLKKRKKEKSVVGDDEV